MGFHTIPPDVPPDFAGRSLRAFEMSEGVGLPVLAGRAQADVLAWLLRRQHGVISRTQALAAGFTASKIKTRVREHLWLQIHPGVYCLAGTRSTQLTRAVAALLHAGLGASLSHDTAAVQLGLTDRPRSKVVHVTVPHRSQVVDRHGVAIHRTRVAPRNRQLNSGLIVTDPVRTLVGLATMIGPRELRAVLHHAVFKGLVDPDELRAAVAPPGRLPGLGALRREVRCFDEESDSGTEVEADELFRRAGIVLTRQHDVFVNGIRIACIDFAEVGLQVAIEVDGAAHHADPAAQARDRRRDRRLTTMGWHVTRIAVSDLRSRPDEILAQVQAVIAQRAQIRRAG